MTQASTGAALDCDVLIVGAGPAGLTCALALARMDIRVVVVSRSDWVADSPRAHITNQRAMEVFRDLGVEQAITARAIPWADMGDMMFATSLVGDEIARIRAWGTGDDRHGDYVRASPCPMVDIVQPEMEPVLLEHARAAGAIVRYGTEYRGHAQDETGVTTSLFDRVTGHTFACRSTFMVGADGARSRVAEDVGLPFEGHMARAGTAYVIFRADLAALVAHRPSTLHWIINPDAAFGEIGMGLLRCVRPWDTWIAGWGYDLAAGDPDLSDATVARQITALVGRDDLDVEILSRSRWFVNQMHATHYAIGRVFCAGDAVHRHPPSSGLGSNTCVQDAHNLAWKLAFVVKGWAGAALLETYSKERAPVGAQVVARANQSRLDYAPLKAALRIDGAPNPLAAGLARLSAPSTDGARARKQLEKAVALKNYEFNAHGVELNQRYTSSAVIAEDCPEEWPRDRQLYVNPTTRPGAKLPHAWLIDATGRRISTLDLVGRGRLTLLTGLSGRAWVDAVEALALPCLGATVIGLAKARDIYGEWARSRGIEEDGALLVRPDGYIAWRSQQGPEDVASASALLGDVLARLLDRPPVGPR